MNKPSFRAQVLQAREDAIVDVVNRLLADKGFEAMTVDAVAAEVGIAKASLYKHFPSKEALAAAAMVRVLDRALALCDGMAADLAPLHRLKGVARWTMEQQLAGQMPALPAQNSTLRAALMEHGDYMDRVMALSERLGGWIEEARATGALNPALPPEAVLFTLFARACDPVLGLLKAGGQYSDAALIDMMLSSCFDGLAAPGENAPSPALATRRAPSGRKR